jgi:hypothetical protein
MFVNLTVCGVCKDVCDEAYVVGDVQGGLNVVATTLELLGSEQNG